MWPPIHDITTDTEDPPRFVAVLPLRAGRVSTPEYDGPQAAEQQRRAYPDLAPLVLGVPPSRVLEVAAAVARGLGWDVVAVDPASGMLEAVATTRLLRFTDDVAVRVRACDADGGPGRSRVDVRSKSRVGRGDLGTNARRIRRFLAALRARVA